MSNKSTLREHLRFSKEELPALIGVISVVVFLHVAGWGLFIHYNSNPAYSSLTDGSGALIYAALALSPTHLDYAMHLMLTISQQLMTQLA